MRCSVAPSIVRACVALILGLSAGAGMDVRAQPTPVNDAVSVVNGEAHSCALSNDGGVRCWGANYDGQLGDGTFVSRTRAADVPGLTSGVDAIAAGANHTCALLTGGGVTCWGSNLYGQLGDTTTSTRAMPTTVSGLTAGVLRIAAGVHHTCAVVAAGVKCWGRNNEGQLGNGNTSQQNAPVDVSSVGAGVTAITLGNAHTCVLPAAGPPLCWGANGNGQLGDGMYTSRSTPAGVTGVPPGALAITAGYDHTCAITSGGGASCWGSNYAGQLGNGTITPNSATPVAVTGLASGVTSIAAGAGLDTPSPGSGLIRGFTCAVVAGGAKCWGYNGYGQLGDDSTTTRTTPVDVTGLTSGVDAIAVSVLGRSGHACALSSTAEVQCWGSNRHGQLGDGLTANRPTATAVQLPSGIAAISAGGVHTCAINSGGFTKCWGYGADGRLGNSGTDARALPTPVTSLASGVTTIRAGGTHSCAIVGGALKCWGGNTFGQIGDNTQVARNAPTDVSTFGSNVTAVSLGAEHTCGTITGGLRCWGRNYDGELGDGTSTEQHVPTAVVGLDGGGVGAIAAGGGLANAHACALTAFGGVKCWGYNGYGQLGVGTFTSSNVPVDVSGLSSGIAAIATGGRHSCALNMSGGVVCWGDNSGGQLGNGTNTTATTPVNVSGLAGGVQAIAAGELSTCALTDGGTVKCWGANFAYQLGDGTTTARNTPVDVRGLPANVTAISVGAGHGCALAPDIAYCWGNNDAGQLGDGTRGMRTTAGAVITDNSARAVSTLTPASNAGSVAPASSASGRYVAFQSSASNLVMNDTNGTTDIFRADTMTGAIDRVSVDDGDGQISADAIEPSISADGTLLLFVAADSGVMQLMGENAKRRKARMKGTTAGVFLRNLLTGTTQRIGTAMSGGSGTTPQISPDGSTIVFGATNTNPMQGTPGKDEVFRVPLMQVGNERMPGTTTCVSCKVVDGFGIPGANTDGASARPALSADGVWVVYQTASKNALSAVPPPCPSSSTDLILRNMLTGVSQRVGAPGNAANCGPAGTGSTSPQIDWAGLRIAFESDQPLKPGDANASRDIYFADLQLGMTTRISETPIGSDANGAASQPTLSGDGNVIAFASGATNLDPTASDINARVDLHVRNRRSATLRRLSQAADGSQSDGDSQRPALNYNGTRLAFDSDADNLAAGNVPGQTDVFQRANPTASDTVFGSNFE